MDGSNVDNASESTSTDNEYTEVTVLGKGQTFLYIVPSFPVCMVTLQEVKLQQDDSQGYVQMFDGFARYCELLNLSLPAFARIPFSYENAFIINVSNTKQQVTKPETLLLLLLSVKLAKICSNRSMYNIIQADEFCRSRDIEGYQLYDGEKVFVMCDWMWVDGDSIQMWKRTTMSQVQKLKLVVCQMLQEVMFQQSHSVIFKCIGHLKERQYQISWQENK